MMKCPYNNFEECLLEKCPSCNYEIIKDTRVEGRAPAWMSTETAIEQGYQWLSTTHNYKFISCKLIDNNVQPVPKTVINNNINNTAKVSMARGIFL